MARSGMLFQAIEVVLVLIGRKYALLDQEYHLLNLLDNIKFVTLET